MVEEIENVSPTGQTYLAQGSSILFWTELQGKPPCDVSKMQNSISNVSDIFTNLSAR